MALTTQLLTVNIVAKDTVEWSFVRPEGFSYQAGQHINIKLPQLLYKDKKGPRRTFTLVSAPHESSLKITTRTTGSGFKRTLPELPAHTDLEFVGPSGKMVWRGDRPVIMIAGGIGITPFKSIISEQVKGGQSNQTIALWYANDTVDKAAYHEFFAGLDAPEFEYLPIMTDDSQWDGETRFIDASFINEKVADVKAIDWYLAGPPAMVDGIKKVLADLGVPEEQVLSESFFGY